MKRYVAELVGTFVLVFGGCGSAVLAGEKIGFAGVSFAFGLSLLAMVYAIGPISGCHINPAVTVGVLLSKKMQPRYAPGYLVAQVIGAILAAEGSLNLFQRIEVFLQPVDMLLHLDNRRPEFGHRAERPLADPWQLRVGTALTHRPTQEPRHEQPQTHADEQTPSQHSRWHTIVLLSMATPVWPGPQFRAPGPNSGTQPRPDHSPTPAPAAGNAQPSPCRPSLEETLQKSRGFNFGWNAGLSGHRVGLVDVDVMTQRRTPTLSASFFRETATRHAVV